MLPATETGGARDTEESSTPRQERRLSVLGWDDGLKRLSTEMAEFVQGFAESVPAELPTHAIAQTHFLDPDSFTSPHILPINDGIVDTTLIIGNPSAKANVVSIVCLRNSRQIPCSSTGNSALNDLSVPSNAMAFIPITITSELGDRIDLLILPIEQVGLPFQTSVGIPAFASARRPMAPVVKIPERNRVWPFEGCGFARLLKQRPPIDSHMIPGTVARDSELFLLIETCAPDERVRLAVVGDRRGVVDIQEDLWKMDVQLEGTTALIPLDLSAFENMDEIQVVVLRDSFGDGAGRSAWFSDAVAFDN